MTVDVIERQFMYIFLLKLIQVSKYLSVDRSNFDEFGNSKSARILSTCQIRIFVFGLPLNRPDFSKLFLLPLIVILNPPFESSVSNEDV